MIIFLVFLTVFLLLLSLLIMSGGKQGEKHLEIKQKIDNLIKENNMNVTKSDYVNEKSPYRNNNFGRIFITENKKNIYYIDLKNGYKINKINYLDILESHVIEDNISMTKTSRKSQLGGVFVGGVIAGGIGAIIGGLSSKKTQENKVRKIELVIVINDEINPVLKFSFLDTNNPADKSFNLYKNAYEKAYDWHKTISVMINNADKESKQTV